MLNSKITFVSGNIGSLYAGDVLLKRENVEITIRYDAD